MCALLAFPGHVIRQVHLVDISSVKSPSEITAHETQLSCISLNHQGTWLTTASEKVTCDILLCVYQLTISVNLVPVVS